MRASVSTVTFAAAAASEVNGGLLGWIACQVGPLRVDGIALRRTRDGRLALSFPVRTDRRGRQHPVLRPVDDAARRDLERQILGALGFAEEPA